MTRYAERSQQKRGQLAVAIRWFPVLLLCFWFAGATVYAQIALPSSGDIGTVAGDGNPGYSGDGAAATSAELYYPKGVAVDSSGNVYIADRYNHVVRKVTASTGYISTVAGNGTAGYSGDGGPATSAELITPRAVAVDGSGNIYIADDNSNVVRKVTASTGYISTVAGTGAYGYYGDGGPATSAKLYIPLYLAVDSSGNIYITDEYNYVIREVVASTGYIYTVAGGGSVCMGAADYWGDGCLATNAELAEPGGLAIDTYGNLYIADEGLNTVRVVSASTGTISPVAGTTNTFGFSGDGGAATSAELCDPSDVKLDASGNLYIADSCNQRIRKVAASTGYISTIAGNGTDGYTGDGGAATSAELNGPEYLAVDSSSNYYFTDTSDFVIRAVSH